MNPLPRPTSPPSSYVVEHHNQHCCHCSRDHAFSVVYARHDTSTSTRQYTPITKPTDIMWNIPIERRFCPVEKIPFCHECLEGVNLGYLRTPPEPVELRKPLHTPAAPATPKPVKAPKRIFTVDDL